MRPLFRDPRRPAAIFALSGLVFAALRAYPLNQAKADPPALGAAAWGSIDARTISPDLARRALIRYAMTCGPKQEGTLTTGPLLQYANLGTLSGPLATVVSCALGAPASATCDQLRECTGEKVGEPAPVAPSCSGVFAVSAISVGPTGQKKTLRVTETCLAQGARCYAGETSAFCGGDPCTPGETYACEDGQLVVCAEGVRLKGPCPVGTTCGPSAGSGVLTCNGTGPSCSDDSARCVGSKKVACIRDGFGKGRESEVDCQAFGLACVATGSGPSGTATCKVDPSPQCDTKTNAWSCEAGLVKSCVGGRFYAYACADLGMAGVCTQGATGPVCKP